MNRGHELGCIQAFLVKHRALRSAAPAGTKRLRRNEAEMAAYWEFEASSEDKDLLDDIFRAQGHRLQRYDSFEVPGIPNDGYVHLLIRDGEAALSPWANDDDAIDSVRCNYKGLPEPVDQASVWLVLLWYCMLHLQYEKINRSMGEVSEYQRARFTKDQLASHLKEELEVRRKEECDDPSDVRSILLGNTSPKIRNRVSGVIAFLLKIEHLYEVEKGVYQQTLLAASEIGDNFEEGLGLLLPLPEEYEDGETPPANIMKQTEEAFDLAREGEIGQETEF